MLARLDRDLAPSRSSVDREGGLLRLEAPADRADLVARVATVVGEMGYVAEPFDGVPNVERWFDAAAADELSQEEARVLAERWVEDLTAEGVIDEPSRIVEAMRAALLETFRAAARTGAVEFARLDDAAFGDVLDQSEAERVQRWIERKLMLPG